MNIEDARTMKETCGGTILNSNAYDVSRIRRNANRRFSRNLSGTNEDSVEVETK